MEYLQCAARNNQKPRILHPEKIFFSKNENKIEILPDNKAREFIPKGPILEGLLKDSLQANGK